MNPKLELEIENYSNIFRLEISKKNKSELLRWIPLYISENGTIESEGSRIFIIDWFWEEFQYRTFISFPDLMMIKVNELIDELNITEKILAPLEHHKLDFYEDLRHQLIEKHRKEILFFTNEYQIYHLEYVLKFNLEILIK